MCLLEYYGDHHPPERRNLEFLIGLRNKIEHRHLPQLDAALYGECQAALMNLEELVVREFGARYALEEQLAVSLQFSTLVPAEKRQAARSLASSATKSVTDYTERFRGKLPATVLNSMKYSFNVFLVPRVANRQSAADAAVQFVKVDDASPAELERLERLNVLIREKHIPIANVDLFKPSEVVEELKKQLQFKVSMATHTAAWKHFQVRPPPKSAKPEQTVAEHCVYDSAHNDYLFTRAWVDRLVRELSDPARFKIVVGKDPQPK